MVYSTEEITLKKFSAELEFSMQSLHRLALQTPLPIAVATNRPDLLGHLRIDKVIEIEKEHLYAGKSMRGDPLHRQWKTRQLYLSRTPFRITLYVDTNTQFCNTAIVYQLRQMDTCDIDFAVSSTNRLDARLEPHNWLMLYRMNRRTRALLLTWTNIAMQEHPSADDQISLRRALLTRNITVGLKLARLSHTFAASWLRIFDQSYLEFFPDHTAPLGPGPVSVLHDEGNCFDERSPIDCCAVYNNHSHTVRQFVRFSKDERPPFHEVHSLAECDQALKKAGSRKNCWNNPYPSKKEETILIVPAYL